MTHSRTTLLHHLHTLSRRLLYRISPSIPPHSPSHTSLTLYLPLSPPLPLSHSLTPPHPPSHPLITGRPAKDKSKNHPSRRPSHTCACASSSEKDLRCIRKGASAIIAVNVVGLVALMYLEPSAPLLSYPLGPPPRSTIYSHNDIVMHVHTFDRWEHRPSLQVVD